MRASTPHLHFLNTTCGHTHAHSHAHSFLVPCYPSCLGHPWVSQAHCCLTPLTRSHTQCPHSHTSVPSTPFLKTQDTPRYTPTLKLAHPSSPTPVFSPVHVHTHSSVHTVSDMGKLLHKCTPNVHTRGLCPLLRHTWDPLTDGHHSSLRCHPKGPGLLGYPGWFPSGGAGVSSCLGWPRVGTGLWPGVQGLAAAVWAEPGCLHLCGSAWGWCQHSGRTLCPPAYRGQLMPGWGCQPHIPGVSGKPKEGQGRQAGPGRAHISNFKSQLPSCAIAGGTP